MIQKMMQRLEIKGEKEENSSFSYVRVFFVIKFPYSVDDQMKI